MAAKDKRRITQMEMVVGLLLISALTSILAAESKTEPSANVYTDWERDLAETTPRKYRFFGKRFYAGVSSSVADLLSILCRYSLAPRVRSTVLRGSRDGDGNFWPGVSLAVSNSRNANWTPIGLFNPTVDADLLTVDRQHPRATLSVAAEPFRPLIGTYRWGRVTLLSDKKAVAVFALEDLLPPRGRRPAGADFKDVLGDREKPLFGSAAVLRYVVFTHGQLTGEFTWDRDHIVGPVKGSQTTAGDFCPAATLAIGDSEDDWIVVGDTKPTGRFRPIAQRQHTLGEPFRVNLEAYRPHIGHAKFGKVTFSDSTFAIFVLKNIDPSVTEDD